MAQVNYETNQIEFDENDLDAAWNNAPTLINKNPNLYRLCYICKFHMEKEKFANSETNNFYWTIDLINAKKPKLEQSNYVAVHQSCIPNRENLNSVKQLKFVRAMKWEFDQKYWDEINK